MRLPDFGLRGRGEAGFCMKDDPNDKVMADKLLAGDVPDIIRARRGLGADQI